MPLRFFFNLTIVLSYHTFFRIARLFFRIFDGNSQKAYFSSKPFGFVNLLIPAKAIGRTIQQMQYLHIPLVYGLLRFSVKG